MATERIDIVLEANTKEVEQGFKDIQKTARDTGITLDQTVLKGLQDTFGSLKVETKKAGDELAKLRRDFRKGLVSEAELKKAEVAFEGISSATTEARRQLQNYRNRGEVDVSRLQAKFNDLRDSVGGKDGVLGAFTGLLAAIGGAGFAASKILEIEKAQKKLAISTGATQEETKLLNESLNDLSTSGFIAIEDNVKVLALVRKEFGLIGGEATKLSKQFLTISEIFDKDLNEIVLASTGLVRNFGIEAGAANDIITQTLQLSGDAYGDILQTLNEYSVQFAKAGISATDFAEILIKGSQDGVFQIDKIGDSLKEGLITITTYEKAADDAFKKAGLNYQGFIDRIDSGEITASQALNEINENILGLDTSLQNEIGTALYKSKWEDIGIDGVQALTNITGELIKTDGQAQIAADNLQKGLAAEWNKFLGTVNEAASFAIPGVTKALAILRKGFVLLGGGVQIVGGFIAALFENASLNISNLSVRVRQSALEIKTQFQNTFGAVTGYFQDTFDNFVSGSKDIVTFLGNLASNIGIAFFNGFQNARAEFGDLANFISNNPLSKKLGLNFNIIDTNTIRTNKKNYKSLLDGVTAETKTTNRDLAKLEADRRKKLLESTSEIGKALIKQNNEQLAVNKKFQTEALKQTILGIEERFNEQSEATKKTIDLNKDLTGSVDETTNSTEDNTTKTIENTEAIKENNSKKSESVEADKEIIESEKEKQEEVKKTAGLITKSYQAGIKSVKTFVDKSKSKIKEYSDALSKAREELKDLNSEISGLETGRAETLGSRDIELVEKEKDLRKEIFDLRYSNRTQDEDLRLIEAEKELNSLIDERRLIRANATQQELAEAQRINDLSPTARFLEQFEQEKAALLEKKALKEQEIADLEIQKEKEEEIFNNLNDFKIELEEKYKDKNLEIEKQITTNLVTEANKRLSILETLRNSAIETANALSTAGISVPNINASNIGGGGTTTNTANNSISVGNITVNEATDTNKVQKTIFDTLRDASENLSNKIF